MRNALTLGSLLAVSLLALACESRVSLGGRCTRREECASLLTCVGSVCREECRGPNECPSGQRCIAGPSGLRACSRPLEETCSATDPCNPEVFAECRAGQCVTGCTVGTDCVSGTCDTSAAVGVCVETVSTGGADAGPVDAAIELDSAADDAGDAGCLPEPPMSSRTLAEAVFGAGATAMSDTAEIWLGDASRPLSLAGTIELAIGVYAGGDGTPRVLAAVNQGPHDSGQSEIAIRRASPFAGASFENDTSLDAAFAMSALSVHSAPTFAHLAVLRPEPESRSAAFTWIVREGSAPQGLQDSVSTFPGRVALFEGPDVEFARELLLLDELVEGRHELVLLGDPFGVGNRAVRMLPEAWGLQPFAMSPARQAVLLHEDLTPRTVLARCTGAEGPAPLLSLAELDVVNDGRPLLLSTATSPIDYRVLTSAPDCDQAPIVAVSCPGSTCTTSTPTTALDRADAYEWEASAWGDASVVVFTSLEGARVVVLDADGNRVLVTDPIELGGRETLEIDTLTLRRSHVAASVSGNVASLAIGGLYVDGTGGNGQVLVRVLRLTRP